MWDNDGQNMPPSEDVTLLGVAGSWSCASSAVCWASRTLWSTNRRSQERRCAMTSTARLRACSQTAGRHCAVAHGQKTGTNQIGWVEQTQRGAMMPGTKTSRIHLHRQVWCSRGAEPRNPGHKDRMRRHPPECGWVQENLRALPHPRAMAWMESPQARREGNHQEDHQHHRPWTKPRGSATNRKQN